MLEGIRLETRKKVRKLVMVMQTKMAAEVLLRNGQAWDAWRKQRETVSDELGTCVR